MSDLETQTEVIDTNPDAGATGAGNPLNGQAETPPETPDYKAMFEEQKAMFEEYKQLSEQQLKEIKDFVGLGEEDDSTTETDDTTEPTAKEQELTAQVGEYKTALQEHVDAVLKSLPEEKQALVKKLGGDNPLAQFRALTSLQEAGVLTQAPKPKNERGSHQGRADTRPDNSPPKTREEFRMQFRQEMEKQGLL